VIMQLPMIEPCGSFSNLSMIPRDIGGLGMNVVFGMCIFCLTMTQLIVCTRCMEHTVVLGASAFLQEISPSFPHNKRSTRKGTVTVKDVNDKEGDDEDDEEWLADWEALDNVADEEEVDESVDFTAGNSVLKSSPVRFFYLETKKLAAATGLYLSRY
jgi:hypothetical protein